MMGKVQQRRWRCNHHYRCCCRLLLVVALWSIPGGIGMAAVVGSCVFDTGTGQAVHSTAAAVAAAVRTRSTVVKQQQ